MNINWIDITISILSICASIGLFEGIKLIIKKKAEKKIKDKENMEKLARQQLENNRKEDLLKIVNNAMTLSIEPALKKLDNIQEDMNHIKIGLQASLRNDLYQLYNSCSRKGFADIQDREDFENIYQQYHQLGANGVMDNIRKKFLNLPIEKERRKN